MHSDRWDMLTEAFVKHFYEKTHLGVPLCACWLPCLPSIPPSCSSSSSGKQIINILELKGYKSLKIISEETK